MDSLASLALATELPKEDLLKRPPYRKKEYIISQKMVKHILGMALF
jgi:magnesium-transporting ATPase (P-type)